MPKSVTSMRMSEEAKVLLAKLAKKLGITQSGIVELAIRRMAEAEKVKGGEEK